VYAAFELLPNPCVRDCQFVRPVPLDRDLADDLGAHISPRPTCSFVPHGAPMTARRRRSIGVNAVSPATNQSKAGRS
jgi:hypothetical protein